MLVDVVRDILKQEREAGEKLGEARGEARGKKRSERLGEARRTWQLARRMHAKGYPIAEIADLTGIPEEKLNLSLSEAKKSL